MPPKILSSHDGQEVTPGLRPLLVDAYEQIVQVPADLATLKASLERLLVFLCSPIGRTHANCVETDRFFLWHFEWPVTWEHLPDSYTDVLGDIGGTLHDTFGAPDIAENFDSTPEQLLERVRGLPVEQGAA
jgi:hypothetical protein